MLLNKLGNLHVKRPKNKLNETRTTISTNTNEKER